MKIRRLLIRNFKCFKEIDVDIGEHAFLIGSNNAGKTGLLQALALWHAGVLKLRQKRGKPGTATLHPSDLLISPVPHANLLWHQLRTRHGKSAVPIEIAVDGESWHCGLRFNYANEASLYCRISCQDDAQRSTLPQEATNLRMAFLAPISGLASVEPRVDSARLRALIGEGQTALVLRNLCYLLCYPDEGRSPSRAWQEFAAQIDDLFGMTILPPRYVPARGEIRMSYREGGVEYDLSSAGRGVLQTMLVLAYMRMHPSTVLLLEEPDAHLEPLRQRQICSLLLETARKQGCQLIVNTHSEVVIEEASADDAAIMLIRDEDGHRAYRVSRGCDPIDQWLARQCGLVLYLESPADLVALQTLARRLNHPAQRYLDRPFVKYLDPAAAQAHFSALRRVAPDLDGLAIYDSHMSTQHHDALRVLQWRRPASVVEGHRPADIQALNSIINISI